MSHLLWVSTNIDWARGIKNDVGDWNFLIHLSQTRLLTARKVPRINLLTSLSVLTEKDHHICKGKLALSEQMVKELAVQNVRFLQLRQKFNLCGHCSLAILQCHLL